MALARRVGLGPALEGMPLAVAIMCTKRSLIGIDYDSKGIAGPMAPVNLSVAAVLLPLSIRLISAVDFQSQVENIA